MRNLKKILALVLALMMAVSVMVFASAASYNDYDDVDEVDPAYAEAVAVLTGIGIYEGYADEFHPTDSVTRAQAAALIYRITTGDVSDANVGWYSANYPNPFSDVADGMWYAGHVNFAANGEWIVGDGQGHFMPNNGVTGYQLLAILLRAIGYGKNGEFQGGGWELNVATTAERLGITDGLNDDVSLGDALTREEVAQLIYAAIQVDQVVYVGGNYWPTKPSIAKEEFSLTKTDTDDQWGRPSTVWYGESGRTSGYQSNQDTTYYTLAHTPLAHYDEAVVECDLVEDSGVSGEVDVWDNGVRTVDGETLSATATRNSLGAQGQETYVYADRLVYIDTYLALVTDVTEARYDDDGHLAVAAETELLVYGMPAGVTDDNIAGSDYAVGTMLLVNVNEDDNAIVLHDVATSFVGAQTTIHFNADYHTINGTNYSDAEHFVRDDASTTEDYNFNWWLDQFGNVIGSTAITSNYAVLKDLIWVRGTPGYAQATLVYMNGTEATVTVDSIDEFDFGTDSWDENDVTPYLADSIESVFNGTSNFGGVSTDSSLNGDYLGYAMYRVDTNADDSVNLEGTERYSTTNVLTIEYEDDATLNINASAIMSNSGTIETHVSSATQFLVNDNGTYTAYTGTSGLARYNAQTVEVFYEDVNGDSVADYVYIKTFSSVFGTYVFATSDATSISAGTAGVYVEGVYVDGVETTILARPDVAAELIRNPGKLYAATWVDDEDTTSWRYGRLVGIDLVNEDTDNDWQIWTDSFANYLNENFGSTMNYVNGTLVVNSRLSYNVSDTVEVIYSNTAYTMNLADAIAAMRNGTASYGVWVVGSRYDNAVTVYVGTELEETNTITVTGEDGLIVADPTAADPDTYVVTIDDKNDNGTLDLTLDMRAQSEYASFEVAANDASYDSKIDVNADGTVTLTGVSKGETYTVTAYTECDGTCTGEEWTIEITGWNIISDAVTKVTFEEDQIMYGQPVDAYYSYETAIDHLTVIDADTFVGMRVYANNDMVIIDDSSNYPVKALAFTTTGLAQQSTEAAFVDAANTIQDGSTHAYYGFGDLQNNGVVVFGFTPQNEGTETVYVAFQITRD